MKQKYNVISLFSGAGGMDLGFKNAGFDLELAVEIDEDYAATYRKNISNDVLVKDINSIDNKFFEQYHNKVFGIVGGPPCQGFSLAGNLARNFIDDPRNYLFKRFLEIVELVNPSFVLIENVANILKHNNGNTIAEIKTVLNGLGYDVTYDVLDSKYYGVPQSRRRLILVGLKGNTKSYTLKDVQRENTFTTIGQTLDDLPPLKSGETSTMENHIAMNHSDQMLEKMSYVPEGGDRTSIPIDLRPGSGDQRKYIRLSRDQVCYCVTGDMRKVFHYRDNRALTVRELARIQTFPDWFVFCGASISQQQQVGNAVPVQLAQRIADSILKVYETESVLEIEAQPTEIFENSKATKLKPKSKSKSRNTDQLTLFDF